MRHGGHQTFTVREGWLVKGLQLLQSEPEAYFDKVDLANKLGVGVNMGLSIEHWLLAAKLVEKNPLSIARSTGSKYLLTDLAHVILQFDPYMTLEQTWWLLHINIVQNPEFAASWDWFFNDFPEKKFEKAQIISQLMRKEAAGTRKTPALKTIERDVACFLSTYAVAIPREIKDPEEDYGSPFQELHLMNHLRASGTYEVHKKARSFEPEIILHSIAGATGKNLGYQDMTLSWLNKQRSGPLQTLCLSSEGIFEQIISMEDICQEYDYTVRSLAGDRQIVFNNPGEKQLVTNMYKRLT